MYYTYTNQRDIRLAFRREFPNLSFHKLKNGDYPTDTRCEFIDWIDYLARTSSITEKLASRVTL